MGIDDKKIIKINNLDKIKIELVHIIYKQIIIQPKYIYIYILKCTIFGDLFDK